MRVTSDKSLRLVLSTFKNLREELCHLQDDLGVSCVLQFPWPHPLGFTGTCTGFSCKRPSSGRGEGVLSSLTQNKESLQCTGLGFGGLLVCV